MMRRLAHRGPDADGIIAEPDGPGVLGHRRLAIVDPPGGDQPIRDEAAHRAIVANGEIHNLPALRSRLSGRYRFRTSSDSEAALALYGETGTGCPSDLDGMFAFADGAGPYRHQAPILRSAEW